MSKLTTNELSVLEILVYRESHPMVLHKVLPEKLAAIQKDLAARGYCKKGGKVTIMGHKALTETPPVELGYDDLEYAESHGYDPEDHSEDLCPQCQGYLEAKFAPQVQVDFGNKTIFPTPEVIGVRCTLCGWERLHCKSTLENCRVG